MLGLAVQMQRACVADNAKNQGVLKAFRMAGYLAGIPTPGGLVKPQGGQWAPFPNFSTRLAGATQQRRFEHWSEKGEVSKPNWKELSALRKSCRQRAREPDQALEDGPAETPLQHEPSECDDALQELAALLGDDPADDPDDLHLDLVSLWDLEGGANACFEQLSPSVKRRVLTQGRLRLAAATAPTVRAERAKKQDASGQSNAKTILLIACPLGSSSAPPRPPRVLPLS